MTDLIGFFVARYKTAPLRTQARMTKYHRIESEIADRKITRCGRQFKQMPGTSLNIIVGPPPSGTGCLRCG